MVWNPGWDTIFSNNEWGKYPPEEVVRFIARHFGKSSQRNLVRILEVGCGPCANIWYLAREGYAAYGIDGSTIAIERGGQRLASEGLSADLRVADAMALPFEDEYFDAVLDIECVYANNMEDSVKIIAEIKRVLKPGGLFFSKTFMEGTPLEALHKGYGVIRFSSEEDIKSLYAPFKLLNVDYMIRSDKNRQHEVREWMITCQRIG